MPVSDLIAITALATASAIHEPAFNMMIKIGNAGCEHCAATLEQISEQEASIDGFEVDAAAGQIRVALSDEAALDEDVILSLVSQAGYKALGFSRP